MLRKTLTLWVLPDTEQHHKHAANVAEFGISGAEELNTAEPSRW